MSQFSFQYPIWFLWIGFLLAVLLAGITYYKTNQFSDKPKYYKYVLAALRTLGFFLLFILLLQPLLKRFQTQIQKPIVAIGLDNSKSLVIRDSQWLGQFNQEIQILKEKLESKYAIETFSFGEKVSPSSQMTGTEKLTDISGYFEHLKETANFQYLRAVILATDGLYNQGKSPLYSGFAQSIPIHTIALGDTSKEKDLAIQRIFFNEIVYAEDQFNVQIDISAYLCSGQQTKLTLSAEENGLSRVIESQNIDINAQQYFKTTEFIVPAQKPGIIKFRLQTSSISGENNTRNNVREFYVEVLDAKQKILIYAQGAHPDISAIKDGFLHNKNYSVDIVYVNQTTKSLEDYNLVIFHQLPSLTHPNIPILQRINDLNTARIFILGSQTNVPQFNTIQNTLKIEGSVSSLNETSPQLLSTFKAFQLSDQTKQFLSGVPPLISPFGKFTVSPTAQVLCNQKIGKIDTDYPLIVFDKQKYKTCIIAGEGIWKWKLLNYLQQKHFEEYYELLSNIVQLTTIKDDGRKFRVIQNKKVYQETDHILLDAELYNDNYERINEPEVTLEIKDQSGANFPYVMGRDGDHYSIDAGIFSQGNYSFSANTQFNGKQLQASGKFTVLATDLESNNLAADHQLLQTLSNQSGGTMFQKHELNKLADSLLSDTSFKAIQFNSLQVKPLLDYKILFFIAFLLLAMEWFLRRYWGYY